MASSVHHGTSRDEVVVDRYNAPARANHWVTAISLILLALSGVSMFHPSLFFLTDLFGGGWCHGDRRVDGPCLRPERLAPRATAMAESACHSQAIGKSGKPLAGAALNSFMTKCTREACEPKAIGKDGRPLAGAESEA